MAILALGIVGASLTSAIGIGASFGWLGGVIVGNLLFGQKSTQEGSRLSDLTVQSSTYGKPIPLIYGTMRFAGNVIWSTALKETRHKKTQSGGKGGGGATQITYTYSVSFAVGLCVGPVSAVRRIWADTKLIYDATASNTQSVEKYPGVIRIFTGTDTQKPDSTMEMYLGSGNVPAHRGIVYLVFTDLQLADFANRIPSIGAEVVSAGGLQCSPVIFPTITNFGRGGGVIDSTRGTMIGITADEGTVYKYDLVNNTLMLTANVSPNSYGSLLGIDSQGYFYHAADAYAVEMRLVKRHPETLAVVAQTDRNIPFTTCGVVRRDKLFCYRTRQIYDLDLKLLADLSLSFPSYIGSGAPMCDDPYGNYWQVGQDYIRKLDSKGNVTSWNISAWTGGTEVPETLYWDDYTGHIYFVFYLGKRIVKWDVNNGFVAYVDGVEVSAGFGAQTDFNLPLNGKLWSANGFNVTKTDLVSMQIVETVNLAPFLPTLATHFGGIYEKFTNSMVIITDAGEIKYPLERYGNDTAPLSGVLSDICLKAGMQATDLLVGSVSQNLRGYIVSNRMSARDALTPLLGTFFIDAVEIDGILNFVPRGQAPVTSIPYDDLGAIDNLSTNNTPLRLDETRKQDMELPLRIDLTYIDPDRYYEANTQHATRIARAVGTQDLQSVELTIVLSASEAAQIAAQTLKNAWIERNSYSFDLPQSHLRLDPTDVVTVNTPDTAFTLRLNQVDFGANNIVACQAVAEDNSAYISTATGTTAALAAVPITVIGPVSLFLLDLPMLVPNDNSIGLYYAFGLRSNVSSAALYRAPDELAWTVAGTGTEGPSFGWASSILGDCARPTVWDMTNTVDVTLGEGTLSSASALDVMNWNNAAALGSEIIQWQTATQLSSSVYRLSGLLRGRRGTEDMTGTHQVGETFVVLAAGGLYRVPLASTDVGQTAYYKGVPVGGNFDDAPVTSLSFQGRSMRCLSPTHITGARDSGKNLTINWIRRSRWYGEWVDNIDVPLFEDSEAYSIDILNGTQIVRTLSATAASTTYTAAQQTTDFGSTQASISVAIYQLNSVTGRGIPAKATL